MAGFTPGNSANNRAGRWLENRGWYSLHALAALLNVKRLLLKRRCLKGQIPYLRVGVRSWWIPPEAVDAAFKEYGDIAEYRKWCAAGKPLREGRKH